MSSHRHQVIREEPYRGRRMEIQKRLCSASFLPAHATCASSPPRTLAASLGVFFSYFYISLPFPKGCNGLPVPLPLAKILCHRSPLGGKRTICRREVLLLFSCERQRWAEAAIPAPTFPARDFHTPRKANRQGRRADCRKLFLSELPDMQAAHHQTEGSFIGTFDLNHIYSS